MHILSILVLVIAVFLLGAGTDEFDRGYEAHLKGEHESAIYHYSRAIREGDLSEVNLARALNNRGVAQEREGRFSRALSDFEAALEMSPGDVQISRNLTAVERRAEEQRQQMRRGHVVRLDLPPVPGPRPQIREKVASFFGSL